MKFRSKFEERVYKDAIENNKKIEYEPDYLPYVFSSRYLIDFRLPNGIIVETKGRLTQQDRRKMLAVKEANISYDIRFVFMRSNNVIRKGSKLTYAGWAEANGFKWAEGKIPLEWWKE